MNRINTLLLTPLFLLLGTGCVFVLTPPSTGQESVDPTPASTEPENLTETTETTPSNTGQESITGTVERVWEDGLSLNTGDRTVTVDTWDIYGDDTPNHVTVGSCVTITGDFDIREFDADTLTEAEAASC